MTEKKRFPGAAPNLTKKWSRGNTIKKNILGNADMNQKQLIRAKECFCK